MKRIFIWILVLAPLLVLLYGMRPIYKPVLSECMIISGTIASVQEGVEFDLVIKLDNQPGSIYYINRGLQYDFDLDAVMDWKLKEAKIWFVDRWQLRLIGNTTWHIARLDIDGKTVFDETL